MALRFIEGFDLNAASSAANDIYLERKATVSGAPELGTGFKIGSSVASNSYVLTTPEFADQDVWILNWAWFLSEAGLSGQAAGIRILRGGSEQLSVDIRSFGAEGDDRFYVDIKRDSTTLATAGPFWCAKWYQFELKVTIDPSSGTYDLKVNGSTVVSDTGVNTAQQAVADADQFVFSLDNGNSTMNLDHVVVADDTGSLVNDFFGPALVVHALPASNGDETDWDTSSGSDHAALVNETMPNNNILTTEDAKRISSETVGDDDRFNYDHLADLGLPSGATIVGVGVETCAGMEASGSLDIRATFKDTGGSDVEGDSETVDSTALGVFVQFWEQNPVTTSSWTVTSIDAGQFGVKVQA